jgi:TIR domain/Pentapeptide repeats (8 copies)
MANPEHLEALRQDIALWNFWREKRWRKQRPDLSGADLGNAYLIGADLHDADLSHADLRVARLRGSSLRNANLNGANLCDADLSYTTLNDADLRDANLRNANLRDCYLSGAIFGGTILAGLDLRTIRGLAEIAHERSSPVELFSVLLPQDGSALHFLREVGVPDEWIDNYRAHMIYPIQYHSLFISYSTKDEILARRLHADLQARGVRCWFAPEDLKIGDKFRQRIDEAIHMQDKLLLLLSEHSIASAWVENEVEAALEKEDQQQREVLFPVRLDETVMQTSHAWAATLRRTRHIGDFTNWAEPQAYQNAFDRLLQNLKQH